ncbi:MAG: alanine racemase [Fibrobacteraceae bacterium]|nr:alanine racemase [Fibrobacteraceae bacterium]
MTLSKLPPDLNNITRPNWIEINLDALSNNIQFIRKTIPKKTKILLPVKADSYGHGSLACAYAAKNSGANFLGVAHMTEGMLLRQYGIDLDILVLGPCIPADFPYFTEFSLTATISDLRTAISFDKYLEESGLSCKAHLGIDTGMHRYGIRFDDFDTIRKIVTLKHLKMEGMYTHLATADMLDKASNENTRRQIDRFSNLVELLTNEGIRPAICHCSSSAGTLRHPESHFDMVRPGLVLYGYNPMGANPPEEFKYPELKPVMTIKSTIRTIHEVPAGEAVSYGQYWVAQQPTKIAAIAIGYGDGYLRGEYNKGFVLIRGELCPILGRVCMDATMVDVSRIPDVQIGETVDVVNGMADPRISMESVAEEHHTIPYEITSRVARRLYRKYIWKNRLIRWDDLKEEFKVPPFTEFPARKG